MKGDKSKKSKNPDEKQMSKDDSKFANIVAILERNGIHGSNGARRDKLAREIMAV